MSRRSKLTKEVKAKLYEAIEAGATYKIAAQYAGIGESTLLGWLADGRNKKAPNKIEFLEEFKRAEANGFMYHINNIKEASSRDYKASCWILERRHKMTKDQQPNQDEVAATVQVLGDTKDILQDQLIQSMKASQDALKAGSYQAFAALQRQTVNIALQLKVIEAENMGQDDNITDDQMLEQISNIIATLPPILKQRLQADIIASANVKSATVIES